MLSWGALTIGLGGVNNYAELTVVRFLLGALEAGLFPGLVYYLTFWYRTSERSLRVALILASATLAGAFGGAIAYGVGQMNGVNGISAWRYLFYIEGAPSCASAFLVWFLLPDYPETASWLSDEEKDLARERLSVEGSHGESVGLTWAEAKKTLVDWRLYAHYLVCFGQLLLTVATSAHFLLDLLRNFHAIFQPFTLYPINHSWFGIFQLAGSVDDGSSVCDSLRCDGRSGVVSRLFQCVSLDMKILDTWILLPIRV
jgi:MFS family permease